MDYYRLNLSRRNTYHFYTEGSLDTYMILYDADGNVLVENDDTDDDFNASITFKPERDAIYYLLVKGYNEFVTGRYTITGETR